jgi:Arc/MetJ-type ribon-helix-helix transcriptional regulator
VRLLTVQLKISISDELYEKLERATKKFKKRTPNAIASEVLQDNLTLWEEVETRRQKLVRRQQTKLLGKIDSLISNSNSK